MTGIRVCNGSTSVVAVKWIRKELKMKNRMTKLLQLQSRGSLILAEHHCGKVNLNR